MGNDCASSIKSQIPTDMLSQRLSELITDTAKLKEHLQCSPQAINQYKSGTARPSLDNLCKIADFYGVSTDYLLGRTDNPNPSTDFQGVLNFTRLSAAALQAIVDLDDRKGRDIAGLNLLLATTGLKWALLYIAELADYAGQSYQQEEYQLRDELRLKTEVAEYRASKKFSHILSRIRHEARYGHSANHQDQSWEDDEQD